MSDIDVMTSKELAEKFGISVSTVGGWHEKGWIAMVGRGGETGRKALWALTQSGKREIPTHIASKKFKRQQAAYILRKKRAAKKEERKKAAKPAPSETLDPLPESFSFSLSAPIEISVSFQILPDGKISGAWAAKENSPEPFRASDGDKDQKGGGKASEDGEGDAASQAFKAAPPVSLVGAKLDPERIAWLRTELDEEFRGQRKIARAIGRSTDYVRKLIRLGYFEHNGKSGNRCGWRPIGYQRDLAV